MATSRRIVRLSVIIAVAVAVLVLNPLFGLLRDDFDFAAPELRVAVEGTWQLTFAPADAAGETIVFTLAQGGEQRQTHATRTLVRSAAACGSRSLVKPAGACIDTTDMPLELTVIAGDPPRPHGGRAMFSVMGTRFTSGVLRVTIGDADVEAKLTPHGDVERVAVYRPGAAGVRGRDVKATLVRTRR